MKSHISLVLVIFLISLAAFTSGCTSDTGLVNEDNGTTANNLSEADQVEFTTGEDEVVEETVVEESVAQETVTEESNYQSPDSIIQEPVPKVSLRASTLSEGRYLLEHKSGEDIDLAKLRLIISSNGQTSIYSSITENSEIMTVGDKLEINTNSGIFTINGDEINVTEPKTETTSLSTSNMILVHIDSEQIIAYMTLS